MNNSVPTGILEVTELKRENALFREVLAETILNIEGIEEECARTRSRVRQLNDEIRRFS